MEIIEAALPPTWVIFDVDGTLTDSVPLVTQAFVQMVQQIHGRQADPAEFMKFVGPPLADSMAEIEPGASAQRIEEMIAIYRSFYLPHVNETPVFPGIEQLLKTLRARGIKLATATSKMEKVAAPMLEAQGIAQYFDVICGAGASAQSTDKAVVVADALTRMGMDKQVRQAADSGQKIPVVMIGDRVFDVVGAAANHVPTLLVNWSAKYPGEEAGAFAVTDDPAQVPALLDL